MSAFRRRRLPLLALVTLIAWSSALHAADAVDEARSLLLRGKYAEALDAYRALADAQPVAAALGIARCEASVGHDAEAVTALRQAIVDHPHEAALQAELARLSFEHGDTKTTDEAVAAALKLDGDQRLARWLAAERLRQQGQLDAANQAYHWFVEDYNAHDQFTADDLHWIGLGAAQYARWNRLSDQFSFLVNDLYPDALKLDPDAWPAHCESALLYMEKYNEAEAARELKAALAINPNATEALTASAALVLQNYELEHARQALDQALAVNPRCADAMMYYADSHLANFELDEAIERLEKARELNPTSEQVLGRLAAAYGVRDGLAHREPTSRLGRMIAEADQRNPHNGEFYAALGAALDLLRKYPTAVEFYQQAVARMPQLVESYGALGMLHLRMGDEIEARRLLDESFDIDPFNVRVSNSLKVLEVLESYAVLETPHFVIKFDRGQDEALVQAMARYLEDDVYPELTQRFGFEPADKSLFEVFSRARNTGGHGWFSARMVGLPYVGTVGACAGKMVAMVSPGDMPKKFNWSRVVKHEFVHVLNLQQTNFNIPHWYTEALAVESEGHPRPQEWNDLLVRRVKAGEVFNLDTINLGFVRPRSPEDWTLAYCQAQLYAQYMVATYGDDALAKMLAAYADNLETRAALKRCFDVDQAAFEQGYTRHIEQLVASLDDGRATKSDIKFADLERAQAAAPDDADLTAQLAAAHLARKSNVEARKLADQALTKQPDHPLATYVVARLRMSIGEQDAAVAMLEKVLDRKHPEPHVLRTLASIRLAAEDFEQAIDLYQWGVRMFPHDEQWLKSLAAACIKAGDDRRLAPVLEQLAEADADDFLVRKKLAQLAIDRGDRAAARRWTTEALYIDVTDAALHHQLGQTLVAEGEKAQAAREFELAVRLDPEDASYRFALADVYVRLDQRQQARETLEQLLQRSPDYPGARELLENLDP